VVLADAGTGIPHPSAIPDDSEQHGKVPVLQTYHSNMSLSASIAAKWFHKVMRKTDVLNRQVRESLRALTSQQWQRSQRFCQRKPEKQCRIEA
jgi:hypothetical protein